MTLKRFTAEGQPNGTALSLSNSATGSGSALGVVSKAGAGTHVYSSGYAAHGSQSILVTCTAAADTSIVGFSGMSANSLAGQFYLYITALPTLSTIELAQIRFSGGSATKLLLSATSKQLQVTDAAGGQIKAFGTALAVNTLYRVNLRATIGTTTTDGTIAAAYYLGDSTTPVETAYTGTGVNAGTAVLTDFRWGKLTGAGDLVAYFDDMAADDGATAFIPSVSATPANVAPTVTVTASKTSGIEGGETITFTLVASDTDGTIASTALTASTGTLTALGGGKWTWQAPATLNGGTYTFTGTATDNGGATGSSTATAAVLAATMRVKLADGTFAPMHMVRV